MKREMLLLSLCLMACAPATPAPQTAEKPAKAPDEEQAQSSKLLEEDTALTDSDGNSFVGPGGWTVTTRKAITVLSPPEGESNIAFVNVSANDHSAALEAAWKLYKKDAQWPLLGHVDATDRDGFSKIKGFSYQTSPSEARVVQAQTMFANGRWLVILVDFSIPVAEKRGGQVSKIFDRLIAKGFESESFAGKKAHALDESKLAELREFLAKAQAITKVPGVAVGVVQGGEVVWAGGLGVREQGKPAKVDEKTLFMIGSNTKALTTLMLAKLVDQGKLTWNGVVTDSLPSFRLGDEATTKQVQIKHLICACTGMPRQDLEWIFEWKQATPTSALTMLGTHKPTSKFGELFQYSNLMAAAAGFVGGHIAYPKLELGAAYDKAMQSLVFEPLAMKSTTFDFAKAMRGNYARPHALDIDGASATFPMDLNRSILPVRPAGAAWSNVEDMLRYVQMELRQGSLASGAPYVGKEALLERRKPNVAIGNDIDYGMGLMVHRAYGVELINHGGDTFGYHSDMFWLPGHDVGAVILTNGGLGAKLRNSFRRKLLELLFDGKPTALQSTEASAKATFDQLAAGRKLLSVPAEPALAEKLAKRYSNAELGELLVSHTSSKTVFDFGEFKSEIASLANPDGSSSLVTISPEIAGLEFVPTTHEGKAALMVRDAQHEYLFLAQ